MRGTPAASAIKRVMSVLLGCLAGGLLVLVTSAASAQVVYTFNDSGDNCGACNDELAGTLQISTTTEDDELLFSFTNELGATSGSPNGRVTGLRFDFLPDQDYFALLSVSNQVGDAPDQNATEGNPTGPDPFGSNYGVVFASAVGASGDAENGIQPGNTDSFILTGFTSTQTANIAGTIGNVGARFQTMGATGEGSAFLIGQPQNGSPS